MIECPPPKNAREWIETILIASAPMAIVILLGLLAEHEQKQRQGRGR